MPGRDTKTRFQGVFARHREACRLTTDADSRCSCAPSYYGVVWDRVARKPRKTRRFKGVIEARNARLDMVNALRAGALPEVSGPKLADARTEFVAAAREGVALNKWGRRYRRRAVQDLQSALRQVPDQLGRRRLGDIRRGDLQLLVDELTRNGMSGSRVRSVVNSLRSLYRWAQDRELVGHNPAELVRLPAMDATPRDRVATPAEFASLLGVLALEDALPYALAGYGTARHQEIRTLDWAHVELKLGAIELAADEEGRKPGGSWRVRPARQAARRDAAASMDRPRAADAGQGLPAEASEQVGPARRLLCAEAGAQAVEGSSGSSRSAFTRRGILPRRGSTMRACRRRWPRSSWGIRRRSTSRAPRRSRSAATRTRCRASWSGRATCLTRSSWSGQRPGARRDDAGGSFPGRSPGVGFGSTGRAEARPGLTRKPLCGQPYRGFESLPLRLRVLLGLRATAGHT